MIIADNNYIYYKILSSSQVIEAAPSLRPLLGKIKTLQARCQTCGGNREAARELETTWNTMRMALAGLPPETKAEIRQHLGVNEPIRIAYRNGSGSNVKIDTGTI